MLTFNSMSLYFFITRRIKEPAFDTEPSYGPFIKLRRIGKGGKFIKVYKLRTMYPYAEYLLSPNEKVWYKYALKNPNPNVEVRYVSFKDTNEESAPRIANVIQHVARIRPV